MVRSRKQSKRMPAKRKFKIVKKVREHNRKARKEAKKNPTKRLKKDPGIPNLFPFKEQLLKQMENRKQQAESERARLKLARQQEAKKKKSLQGLQNEALRKTREFEMKQALQSSTEAELGSTVDPRSLRAYHREFRQVVERADVILEVLDARDPLGTRCVAVEQSVLDAGTGKKLILVLNKIDLVPKAVVEAWLKHLRNIFPTVAFKASTQTQKQNLSRKRCGLGSAPSGVMASSVCLGAELLLKLLGNYCRNADIKTSIVVGVVGLPNVGKSSIINSLKRSKACSVGATPGITKSLQEIQLDKHVKLLDSPGIVMATGSGDPASLVLRNCIKVESIADPVPAVEAILRRCSRLHVMEHYCVPEFDSAQELLPHLARRTGRLKKGGIPDTDAAARTVLRDWNTGRITFYTHPPEQHTLPTHVSADLVKEWGQAFDLKVLEAEEKEQLSGLQEKMETAMVVESEGMVTEVFQDSEEEEGEEDSDLEEKMGSEVSGSGDDGEDMEGEGEEPSAQGGEMTVVFQKKPAKGVVSVSRKEEKEREQQQELNPQVTKAQKRNVKRKMKENVERRRKLAGALRGGDVEMTDADRDSYDFNEYF